MTKSVSTFFIVFFILSGCKSLQKTQQKDDSTEAQAQVDSTQQKIDTIQVVIKDTIPTQEEVTLKIHPKKPDTISIIGIGDIMIGTNFPNEGYLPPNSGKYTCPPPLFSCSYFKRCGFNFWKSGRCNSK